MQISYSNILKDAWQITVKNKILWLFGIFASFISLEAVYEIIISQITRAKSQKLFHQQILSLPDQQSFFLKEHAYYINQLATDFYSFFTFILLILAIALFIWLVFTAQIFIIKIVAGTYQNKKINDTSEELADSSKKFWPVLGLTILTKILLYAIFLGLSLPLLYSLLTQNNDLIRIANLFFFICFTISAIIISFLAAYATNYIVLKNATILESIKYAWKLFSKNITISLEVAFMLFFLKILSLIFIFCLLALIFIPLFIVLMIALLKNLAFWVLFSAILIVFFFILICLFINSVFTVFYLSSWTITFIKLSEESLIGKIINFVRSIPLLFKKTAAKYHLKLDKKKANLLLKEAKQEAKFVGQKFESSYKKYKPIAKKEGQIMAKKIKKVYSQLLPRIEKDVKKLVKKSKKPKRK